MTIGAGANIELVDGATVTWILGGALNLGAGTTFSGETYVKGAVNGATSDVECGNLYATGAVSVSTIGDACLSPVAPATCPLWSRSEFIENLGEPAFVRDNYPIMLSYLNVETNKRYRIVRSAAFNNIETYYTDHGRRTKKTFRDDMGDAEKLVCKTTLSDAINRRL
jgi:hypothetical protein